MLLWDTQLINVFIDLCRTNFFSASLFPCDSSLKKGAITDNWAFKKPLFGIGYLTCSENSISVRFTQCKFPWPLTLYHRCHVSHGGGLIGFCPPKGVSEAPVPTSSRVKDRTALQKLCNALFSLRPGWLTLHFYNQNDKNKYSIWWISYFTQFLTMAESTPVRCGF